MPQNLWDFFNKTRTLRVLVYLSPGQKARLAYWNSSYYITFNVFPTVCHISSHCSCPGTYLTKNESNKNIKLLLKYILLK